jgi:phospholipase C
MQRRHHLYLGLALTLSFAAIAVAPRRRAAQPGSSIKHIIVVVLENEDATRAEVQPYMNELALRGAHLRNYHALTHPSQPNYIAMVAGTPYVTTNDPVVLDVKHLGDLLEEKGLTWKVYAEHYPGNCFLGETAGLVSTGQYVQRHVPFLRFKNVRSDPARCARVVEASALDADIAAGTLPSFALYVPDNANNGHDTGVANADRWLRSRFEPLLGNPGFTDGTLLVVTFDEGTPSVSNIVYTVLVGPGVARGSVSNQFYDHYSLLRTIEAILGTGTLEKNDATADVIRGVWN